MVPKSENSKGFVAQLAVVLILLLLLFREVRFVVLWDGRGVYGLSIYSHSTWIVVYGRFVSLTDGDLG